MSNILLPWALTRMDVPSDPEHMRRLWMEISKTLFDQCEYCYKFFDATGCIALRCSVCGAERCIEFIERMEKAVKTYQDPTTLTLLERGIRG